MSTLTMSKPKLSVKVQTLATVTAIIAAVAVPQLFHVMGAVSVVYIVQALNLRP